MHEQGKGVWRTTVWDDREMKEDYWGKEEVEEGDCEGKGVWRTTAWEDRGNEGGLLGGGRRKWRESDCEKERGVWRTTVCMG